MPSRPPFHQPTSSHDGCWNCQHRTRERCTHALDPKDVIPREAWCGWHREVHAKPFVVVLREPGASDPHLADPAYELVYVGEDKVHLPAWQLRILTREGRL